MPSRTERGEPRFLLGIDEAGTGAWSGPFCIGGAVFPIGYAMDEVRTKKGAIRPFRDSKKLSPEMRERMRTKIEAKAVASTVGYSFPADIEKHGQGVAWQIAITNVVDQLLDTCRDQGIVYGRIDILVDGSTNHQLTQRIHTDVYAGVRVYYGPKADESKFAVCAASILAKTNRDEHMRELHQQYPEYNFAKNKGYGTEEHAEALVAHGRTKFHRPLTKKWDLADR